MSLLDSVFILVLYSIVTVFYNAGQLFAAIVLKVHRDNYFLGFGSKGIRFTIAGVKFTLGFFIPLFPFARVYTMVNGKKERGDLPWELHSCSLGRRWLVTFAGTMFLVLTGTLSMILMLWMEEDKYISREEVSRYGIYPSELAAKAGFKKGDKIQLFNGKRYERFEELQLPESGTRYQILREGNSMEITITDTIETQFYQQPVPFLELQSPFKVEVVVQGTPAERAGLQKGDVIAGINDVPVASFPECRAELLKNANTEARFTIKRILDDSIHVIHQKVLIQENGRIGFIPEMLIHFPVKKNSLGEAVVKGVQKAWHVVDFNVSAAPARASDRNMEMNNRYYTIAPAYGSAVNWERLLRLLGMFFVYFGFLSILPLPRAVFWETIPLVYEGFTKKQFSKKAFKVLMVVSWLLIAAFMLYEIVMDFVRFFG